MPDAERYVPLDFPLKGLELNSEFEEQPPQTTPVGNNVRARDVLGLRARGGQRPGLVKYIAGQIPGGAQLVQHLNYIVDPTEQALRQNFLTPDGTWVPDPRNPGQFVPLGGWGNQPNQNASPPPGPGSIKFVQQAASLIVGGGGIGSVVLPSAVASGSLLVACISTESQDAGAGDPNPTVTVTNGGGTPYTQAGSYAHAGVAPSNVGDFHDRVSLWFLVSTGVANDKTVQVTPSAGANNCNVTLLNYSGAATVGVLDASGTAEQNDGVTTTIATGAIAASTGDVVVVSLGGYGVTITPPTTPVTNERQNPVGGGGTASVADRLGLGVGTVNINFQLDSTFSALVAATFKKHP
jgi:hypothetical protein